MRKTVLIAAMAAGLFATGCATRHHHHYDTDAASYRHYDVDRDVIVHSDGTRTYVREYESPSGYDRNYDSERRLQPRHRGKHPDALGWNDPYWYDSSRY